MTMNEERLGLYSDFIGEYHNVIDSSFCRSVIKSFDYHHDIGSVFCENQQFSDGNAGRFDWAIDMIQLQQFMEVNNAAAQFNKVLWTCWDDYVTEYGHLRPVPMYSIHHKVQKTPAGGGYHVWHDERIELEHSRRCAVWMLYLNDDYDGGETEFLYQHKRIKPETGKMLIWPSGYTHAHRGGLVTYGTKYIVTGWFYFGGANGGQTGE